VSVPRYLVLGPLVVRAADGAEIDLGPPKQRAVLGLLLLERGGIVANERMIDSLWGASPPPSALASLQAYVSNLRRALRGSERAASPITRRAPGYALEIEADQIDLADFIRGSREARRAIDEGRWAEALETADRTLALWRGRVLEDVGEDWAEAEGRSMEELRNETREARIVALLATGDTAAALAEAQALRASEPLRERACWLLMLALYRSRRTPEALEEFGALQRRFDEELGLEVGEELRELQVSILRQEPELAAWPRTADWSGASEPTPPAAAPATAERADGDGDADLAFAEPTGALVGRERETSLIEATIEAAAAGSSQSLLLSGPAGIGKTRLAEELARHTRAAGGREAWARCPEEEGSPAWWPVRQIVRALGGDPDEVLQPPADVDVDGARFAVYERVADLVARAAAPGPLALVIDDVQWADPTSARCLAYLAGALRGVPVVLALTLREGEDRTTIEPLLAALARGVGHRQLTVPALAAAGVGELAGRIAGETIDAEEARRLAERTGGNPLFVSEYARLSPEERHGDTIPLAVRAVVGGRLAGLDPAVMEVLRAAAAIGDVIDFDLLARATRLEVDELADLLDEAADEHVIVAAPDTGGYAFAHGLQREEVLAAIPDLRRRRLHKRIAEAIGPAEGGERLDQRARHMVAAMPLTDPAEVLAACRAAALDAEARWTSESAARWWGEAIRAFDAIAGEVDEGERDELLVLRVEALARAGRAQTVLEVVDAGIEEAVRLERTGTVGRLAAALLRSSGAWPWVAYGADPGPVLARLAGVEGFVAADPAALARVRAALAVGSCYDPDPGVPDGLSRSAIALAEGLGDPDVLADTLLGRAIRFSGVWTHAEEVLELLGRLRDLEHRNARVDVAIAHDLASMMRFLLTDFEGAEAEVAAGIAAADQLRLPIVRTQLRWMEGALAQWHGDFEEAERQNRRAYEVHKRTELYGFGTWEFASGAMAWDRGTLAEMETPGEAEPVAWEAAIAAARGEDEKAAADVNAWLDRGGPVVWNTLAHQVLIAHVACDLGMTDAATRLLERLEPARGRIANIGQCGGMGPVALVLGRLRRTLGDEPEAKLLFEQALAEATRGEAPPSILRCRRELALGREPSPERDTELHEIAAEAERLGMQGLAAATPAP
jgi:DNA-binding SARP family transcriptional activator/DNA polymerase III delta prime subunit